MHNLQHDCQTKARRRSERTAPDCRLSPFSSFLALASLMPCYRVPQYSTSPRCRRPFALSHRTTSPEYTHTRGPCSAASLGEIPSTYCMACPPRGKVRWQPCPCLRTLSCPHVGWRTLLVYVLLFAIVRSGTLSAVTVRPDMSGANKKTALDETENKTVCRQPKRSNHPTHPHVTASHLRPLSLESSLALPKN